MPKFAQVRIEWDGSERAAKLRLETRSGAEFDEGYGIGYVVRPGGATTLNDFERLQSIDLKKDALEIKWHVFGGQNHTIQVNSWRKTRLNSGPSSMGPSV